MIALFDLIEVQLGAGRPVVAEIVFLSLPAYPARILAASQAVCYSALRR
ncbi:MAG: hypothetical protein O3A47_09120 [Chloroflexi bacterium]|nr:hypothetical protein [Chloroflexota bacterium]